MKKLGIMLSILLMIVFFAVSASALSETGNCGENIKWNYDSKTGELVISGTGDMSYEESPFEFAHDVKKVVIEEGVTSIGKAVFSGCSGLESVIIPDSITTIGEEAFYYCTSLESISIPKNVVTIGHLAFTYCENLKEIVVDEDNKAYSTDSEGVLFNKDKTELLIYPTAKTTEEYTIPDSVVTIGDEAFRYSYNLKTVSMGNNVKTIGKYAFDFCSELTDITIGKNVTILETEAFSDCAALTVINIPASVTLIGRNCFSYCDNLAEFIVDEGNSVYSNDTNGLLFNKDKTELIKCPLGGNFVSYTIPNSVTTISDYAFEGCSYIKDITISDGVENIGYAAFYGCSNITEINLPDSVKSIGSEAFISCSKLKAINIPDGVETIGERILSLTAYNDDENNWVDGGLYVDKALVSVNSRLTGQFKIKEGTSIISDNVFFLCTGIDDIIVPDSITKISDRAFNWCHNLEKVTLPGTITKIGNYAFPNGSSLEIVFDGTKKQWESIEVGTNNDILYIADITYLKKDDNDAPHVHEYTTDIIKATLKEDGSYQRFCAECGYVASVGVIYKPAEFILSANNVVYNGKTITPIVTVEDKLDDEFIEGEDYTVSYENGRVNPGRYAITITFKGSYEGEKTVYLNILPGKTSKITATQGTDNIKLSWKKVTGADGYKVYQYNSKTGKYQALKTVTGTSYTVNKLKAGTTYKFAVKAYTKDDGETLWATSSASLKTCTKPANPAPKATSAAGKVTIKWSKVTGATGYVIYMQDSFGDYNKIATTKSTSYTKKSLKKGKTYYFRVRAYKTLDGKTVYGGYKTVKIKVK